MKIKFLEHNEKKIYIFLIFIIFISYLIGFYFQENSAGGAIVDFENTKRNLATFKNNSFIDAIKATTSKDPEIFRSTRAPGFYLFNKYFNPFGLDFNLHKLFISLISLFIPIFLFLNLKIKYNKENNYTLLFLSSIVLLSPYLRSSAYWGNEENFGILIATISNLFFQLYLKEFSRTKELYNLILMAFFSSLVVYCDQKLIIVPLFFLISILFSKKNIQDKIFLIIMYLIFAIPFLFLIKLWGGIVPTADSINRNINLNINSLNYHYFLFSISIISFYLFPFSSLLKKKQNILNLIILKKNYFINSIFLIALTYFLFFFNFENFYYLGGGVFHQLSKILFDSVILKKIFLSLIFIFSWILLLLFKNNSLLNFLILIFFPVFSLIISPALFQEYFDPIFFIIVLLYLKNNYFFNLKSNLFIFSYFASFLFFGIIHY